jgi:hypothetical protein
MLDYFNNLAMLDYLDYLDYLFWNWFICVAQ